MHLHCCHTSPLLCWEMENGKAQHILLSYTGRIRSGYHSLNPQNRLSEDLQCTLLPNAVHLIMDLRQVKCQPAQFKTHTCKDLSCDKYCSLLLSAAQQYDAQIGSNGSKMVKRRVYEHDFSILTIRIFQKCQITTMTLICL